MAETTYRFPAKPRARIIGIFMLPIAGFAALASVALATLVLLLPGRPKRPTAAA